MLGKLVFQAAQQSGSAEPVTCVVHKSTIKKAEPTSYTKLKRMAVRYLEQRTRVTHFSSRDRLGEKHHQLWQRRPKQRKMKSHMRNMRLYTMDLEGPMFKWRNLQFQARLGGKRPNRQAEGNLQHIVLHDTTTNKFKKFCISRKDEAKVLI